MGRKNVLKVVGSAAVEFWNAEKAQMGLGNILGGASSEVADVLGKPTESANRNSFSREFNVGDFDSFGGDVTDGKFVEIARFRVPANTEYSWGYGKANNPENQGYLYVDLQNGTPAAVDGTIRFVIESSTGRRTEVVQDFDTERLDASKTDRGMMVPFPEQVGSAVASEDAYMTLRMDPNANDTVNAANSDVIIPATEYDLS